jgi:hypothetical protein
MMPARHSYKELMMDLLADRHASIVDAGDTIIFERPQDSIIFNLRENTCDYMIGGVRMSRVVVHRYVILVALKRAVEEAISDD